MPEPPSPNWEGSFGKNELVDAEYLFLLMFRSTPLDPGKCERDLTAMRRALRRWDLRVVMQPQPPRAKPSVSA